MAHEDRTYFVRVEFPSIDPPIYAVGVGVEGSWVERMMPRARERGLDEEACYQGVAIDSARIQFERKGYPTGEARILECRRVDANELSELMRKYQRRNLGMGIEQGGPLPPPKRKKR